MCRHMSVSLRPNQEPEDIELSDYRLETPSNELKWAQKIKEKLESSMLSKTVLFLVTMLATSMVIGDGVLTPCVSVLSAVSGVKSLGEGCCDVDFHCNTGAALQCAAVWGRQSRICVCASAVSLVFLHMWDRSVQPVQV
nr:potassium transporter 5-like [Ipomoea batatas]